MAESNLATEFLPIFHIPVPLIPLEWSKRRFAGRKGVSKRPRCVAFQPHVDYIRERGISAVQFTSGTTRHGDSTGGLPPCRIGSPAGDRPIQVITGRYDDLVDLKHDARMICSASACCSAHLNL